MMGGTAVEDRPSADGQLDLDLPTSNQAPGMARHEVAEVLADVAPDLVGDAELLVSELVTNAVRAKSSQIRLVMLVAQQFVLVQVYDCCAGRPKSPPASVAPDQENGRGLFLVCEMSDDWGIERTAGGNCCWFVLVLPAAEER